MLAEGVDSRMGIVVFVIVMVIVTLAALLLLTVSYKWYLLYRHGVKHEAGVL